MNVLPLVSAFILIFAICSYTFVHNVRTAMEEKIHFSASHRISRKFVSNLTKKAYAQEDAKNLHPTKKEKTKVKKETPYRSPRDFFNKKPESKLNIRPLLEVGDHIELEKIVLSLLQDLYRFAPFYKPDLEKEILTTIVEVLKENPNFTRFDLLLSKIPEDQMSLFYKLSKGTHHYKLHTTVGYPAIGDFISLETMREKDPPMHFCYCSRPLLEAVFGPIISGRIINEEKHKWELKHKHQPMSKEELEAFLLSYRLSPVDYQELFSYGTASHTSPIEILHDAESHLQIKIEK